MSFRKKRKKTPHAAQKAFPKAKSPTAELPLAMKPEPASSQTAEAVQTLLGRLNEKSHLFSNWGQFGAFCVAFVGIWFQWRQIEELKQGKIDSDNQLEVVRESVEVLRRSADKQRRLEILPRLLFESQLDPIPLNSKGYLEDCSVAGVRIRNVGRGTAYNVIATATFYRIDKGEKNYPPRHGIGTHVAVERKTIPPGGTLNVEHFICELKLPKDSLGIKGMIGLYCQNEDTNEFFETQSFVLNMCDAGGGPHLHLDFITPEQHPPDKFGSGTSNQESVVTYLNILTKQELGLTSKVN